MKDLTYETRTGAGIRSLLGDLARLRIEVFRDYPYLYEGSVAYERDYLETYARADRALLFAVYDHKKMVGATTAIPLADETPEVQHPFLAAGVNPEDVFYFGESILLKPYRGLGLGHRFFDVREKHAGGFGTYKTSAFCAVNRPGDHPAQPRDYRPNDVFWNKRGYTIRPDLVSFFEWKDLGESAATQKKMTFWTRPL